MTTDSRQSAHSTRSSLSASYHIDVYDEKKGAFETTSLLSDVYSDQPSSATCHHFLFAVDGPSLILNNDTMVNIFSFGSMNSIPLWLNTVLWILLYGFLFVPVTMFKYYDSSISVREITLFLLFTTLQILLSVVCLHFVKHTIQQNTQIFQLHQMSMVRQVQQRKAINTTDRNLLFWLAVNFYLFFISVFYTKSYREGLCYLAWNFLTTLPVSLAVSVMAGIAKTCRNHLLIFHNCFSVNRLFDDDVKEMSASFIQLNKILRGQSQFNSFYLLFIMITSFLIIVLEIVRIYAHDTTIPSVVGKGAFYWIALLEIVYFIASLNNCGRFVTKELVVTLLEISHVHGEELSQTSYGNLLLSALHILQLEFLLFGGLRLSFESVLALILSVCLVLAPRILVPLLFPGVNI